MVAVEVTERSVRTLADGRSFERGQAYFAAGRVRQDLRDRLERVIEIGHYVDYGGA